VSERELRERVRASGIRVFQAHTGAQDAGDCKHSVNSRGSGLDSDAHSVKMELSPSEGEKE